MFAYSYEQWHARSFAGAQAREWMAATVPEARLAGRPLDERILGAGAVCVYHDHERFAEDAVVLRTLRYRVHLVDASRFMTTGAFHSKIRFMIDHRGRYEESIDGFEAALAELEFSDFGRAAVLFRHFDVFARHCGPLAEEVVARLKARSEHEASAHRRLVTLLHADAPSFAFDDVGPALVVKNEVASERSAPKSGIRFRRVTAEDSTSPEDTIVELEPLGAKVASLR